jgi:hypothetical protein
VTRLTDSHIDWWLARLYVADEFAQTGEGRMDHPVKICERGEGLLLRLLRHHLRPLLL